MLAASHEGTESWLWYSTPWQPQYASVRPGIWYQHMDPSDTSQCLPARPGIILRNKKVCHALLLLCNVPSSTHYKPGLVRELRLAPDRSIVSERPMLKHQLNAQLLAA